MDKPDTGIKGASGVAVVVGTVGKGSTGEIQVVTGKTLQEADSKLGLAADPELKNA